MDDKKGNHPFNKQVILNAKQNLFMNSLYWLLVVASAACADRCIGISHYSHFPPNLFCFTRQKSCQLVQSLAHLPHSHLQFAFVAEIPFLITVGSIRVDFRLGDTAQRLRRGFGQKGHSLICALSSLGCYTGCLRKMPTLRRALCKGNMSIYLGLVASNRFSKPV